MCLPQAIALPSELTYYPYILFMLDGSRLYDRLYTYTLTHSYTRLNDHGWLLSSFFAVSWDKESLGREARLAEEAVEGIVVCICV